MEVMANSIIVHMHIKHHLEVALAISGLDFLPFFIFLSLKFLMSLQYLWLCTFINY